MAPIGQNGIVTLQLPEEDESEEVNICTSQKRERIV